MVIGALRANWRLDFQFQERSAAQFQNQWTPTSNNDEDLPQESKKQSRQCLNTLDLREDNQVPVSRSCRTAPMNFESPSLPVQSRSPAQTDLIMTILNNMNLKLEKFAKKLVELQQKNIRELDIIDNRLASLELTLNKVLERLALPTLEYVEEGTDEQNQ